MRINKIKEDTVRQNQPIGAMGAERERAKTIKHKVYKEEKNNHDKLYIYRVNADWWRMGGNSALFYHYQVAVQIDAKSSLRMDNDYYDVWQTGIVAIHDINTLLKKLQRIKATYQMYGNCLVVVELPDKFSDDDINRFAQNEQAKADQFNKLVAPNHVMPRVGTKIDALAERIANKAFNLPVQRYNAYGARGVEICIQMQIDFVAVSNGVIELDDYAKNTLANLEQVSEYLVVAKKYNLFDNSAALDCARHIEFLRNNLAAEVRRAKRKQEEQEKDVNPKR